MQGKTTTSLYTRFTNTKCDIKKKRKRRSLHHCCLSNGNIKTINNKQTTTLKNGNHIGQPNFARLDHTVLMQIHTLRVHYARAAANLNSEYSKYAKEARVHYFCTIALVFCLFVRILGVLQELAFSCFVSIASHRTWQYIFNQIQAPGFAAENGSVFLPLRSYNRPLPFLKKKSC